MQMKCDNNVLCAREYKLEYKLQVGQSSSKHCNVGFGIVLKFFKAFLCLLDLLYRVQARVQITSGNYIEQSLSKSASMF